MSKRKKKKQQPETIEEFLKTLSLKDYPKVDPKTRTITGIAFPTDASAEYMIAAYRQFLNKEE